MSGSTESRDARRILIRGVVQGVGFRPFVHAIAARYQIDGWVLNSKEGVAIHAEGAAADVDSFLRDLNGNPPIAARISSIEVRRVDSAGCTDFQILQSVRDASPTVLVSPDLAVCDDCLREMRDPANRRYGYPYINCTNCGPRYSIVRRLPYDRANTTMAAWNLCAECQREYDDPGDRRHHAQPIACQTCGPSYRLVQDGTDRVSGNQAILAAAEMLKSGRILAVKGIGGYHLACDAANPDSVAQLRTRKFRKEKPFAVMVRTLEEARTTADLSAEHERLLADVSRPIVIAPGRCQLPGVAPDASDLGVMLPYAPLHHLLFDAGAPSPLVLTSANRSSEPIAYRDQDARDRLSGIADAFLIGQRPIARRVEDSVVAVRDDLPFMIRRSRGSSPGVVATLPTNRKILAVGADLKNAIALVVDGNVLVSQHIGDLDDWQTYEAFEESVDSLLGMYGVDSAELTVAHDLHPQFKSTRFAESLPSRQCVAVQHHHAHVASVLAEHELFDEPVIGVAFDGAGYGNDGSIWGGEFFVGGIVSGFERCTSLRSVRMPGGDAAARFPVQAAAAFLTDLDDLPDMSRPPFCFPKRYGDSIELVMKSVRCFRSTSAGRLFDTVAALVGFTKEVTFEGQAAVWLENHARQSDGQRPYPFAKLDHRTLLQSVIHDRLAGRDIGHIAFAFHAGLAVEIAKTIFQLSESHDIWKAVLSGGVFQNELLVTLVRDEIIRDGRIKLLTNGNVPANDGGICLGQAAMACRH